MTTAPLTPGPTALTRTVLADNPSGMTLTGTNTYLLFAPESNSVVVVDPGPVEDAEQHWDAVVQAAEGRTVELILVTHRHGDHTGAVELFHERSGAPVRAVSPDWCRQADPLTVDEELAAAGVAIHVLHTPGHTSDSASFLLPDDGPAGSVLTGDTILGSGTTMLDHPDGTMADYLASMDRLASLGQARVLPAHGPMLESIQQAATDYRNHRLGRLEQVRGLLEQMPEAERAGLSQDELAAQLAETVYPGLEGMVRRVSVQTLAAQLRYLAEQGS